MPVAVFTPHQQRRVLVVFGLAHCRRDVLHVQSDAPIGAAVRHRGVQCPAVMKRRLAGLERTQHGLVLVDIGHGLPLVEDVRRVIGDVVVKASPAVAAGQHAHASALGGRGRQRQPQGHFLIAAEAPVSQVLVPADVAL